MSPQWWKAFTSRAVPEIPANRSVSNEEQAGVFSKLLFSWLNPLISSYEESNFESTAAQVGYRRPLEPNDIWIAPSKKQIDTIAQKLDQAFLKRLESRSRFPLLLALYDTFKVDFWLGAFNQFVVSTTQVMAPFTLRFLIRWQQSSYYGLNSPGTSVSIGKGIGYVIGIAVMQLLQVFASGHFYYRSMLLGGQSRSAIIALTFGKALKLSNRAKAGGDLGTEESGSQDGFAWRVDPKGWSNGRVMSLISNDTARVEQAMAAFHLSWLSLYQLALTVSLLIYNLGWTALTGTATLVIGLSAVTCATKPLIASRAHITKFTDQRVTLTQEMLQGIRFIKYFSWERFFLGRLKHIRATETRALQLMHLIRCAVGTLAQFLPVLGIMITFIVYAVIHKRLEPDVVFSSLAMFYLLRTPTNWLPISITLAADAVESLKRLENFLLAEEISQQIAPDPRLSSAVKLIGASFSWETSLGSGDVGKSAEDPKKPTKKKTAGHEPPLDAQNWHALPFSLNKISLECKAGELVGIIGNVGSGKTSLLSSLAGDMRQCGGSMQFSANRAYCPQDSWIQNASVRNNIIFGQAFDEERYAAVVQACALRPDFELLPHGDRTEIGERGVTLSGGQKQRINIARAAYSDAGIVLLDDPLSAVDAHVGMHLFDEAICGLMLPKCRILATHHLHLLSRFDKIIWMANGQITAEGTFSELMASNPKFRHLIATRGQQHPGEEAGDEHKKTETQSTTGDERDNGGKGLMQEDVKAVDGVPLSVYVAWLRASGTLWNGVAMAVSQSMFRASSILGGLWLSWWVDNRFGLTQGQNAYTPD
ncbi:Oligomycin resistance ATP-dependent permease YOR1 [Beauveria bassiana]|uniref:Oligomycin resistance ATP-dependent permease YOR1 n=1 Tax=Beauveria bassiana TaxID=176275 RepID=A0A2N6NU84_BEABA|nr:Oligomycin resistance ATP-dependent permease YOR1 [Beauveria bassiana]